MSSKKWMVGMVVAVLAFAVTLSPMATSAFAQSAPANQTAQVPQPAGGGVNWSGAGYGAAAVLGNVLYIPAKLVYAIAGTLVGGASYLITAGNIQPSETIWRSSLGGDWVITPDMVAGNQPLNFSGPTYTAAVIPMSASMSTTPMTAAEASAMGNAPAGPAPMATSSSAGPVSRGSAAGAQPIDSGSGPVRSSSRMGGSLPEMTIQ